LTEFDVSPENKFKLSLLSIEKRFIELEGAMGEMQQKLQNLPVADTKDLEQRISDLEDLIYVEQAGIEELKGMLERGQEKKGISAEEVEKIAEPIIVKLKADLEAKIEQMKGNIGQLQSNAPESPMQMQEMSDKLMQFEMKLRALHHFRAELDIIKNKVAPLNAEVIKSIIAEISDLRIETGREIREIKDKIGNTPLYADVEFLSNRVKDLKLTVDNMLNMKVELESKLLNMERNMAEGGGSSSVAANLIDEVGGAKKQLFEMQKRISSLDAVLKDFMKKERDKEGDRTKQMEMSREIETLYSKINDLYADIEQKALNMNRLAPVDFENKIADFNSKIFQLQNEMNKIAGSTVSDKNDLSSKVSKLEEQVHILSSRTREVRSPAYEDQMKELLEKLILLEIRVNVLETNISQPHKMQPIILE